MRGVRTAHAVSRLMLHSGTDHIQASRVKLEAESTRTRLQEGADNRPEKADSGLERTIHGIGPCR